MTKIPESLKQALRDKRVIPFIGAGVSRNVKDKAGNALFPDWPTLLRNTIDKLRAEGKDPKADRVQGALNDNTPDYLEAAKHARDGLGPDWYDYLQKIFKRSRDEVDDESLQVAGACWKLGSRLLITGNYENVLGWAYPGSDDPELWKIESLKEQVDLLKNNATTGFPTVWHLHGHISDVRNLILTPDGYAALYPQENENAIEQKYDAALSVLKTLLTIRQFLFIGFSMNDKQFESQMKFVDELFKGTAARHYILLQKDAAKNFEPREYLEPISFESFEDLPSILEEMAAIVGEGHYKREEIKDKSKNLFGGEPKIPFNVPFRSKEEEFVGRIGKLDEIRRAFLSNSVGVAIGQAVGIEGMGGLGKTQLAVEYAHKFRSDYPNGVVWFIADGDMEGQLRLIAVENEWVNEFDKPENQLIMARRKIKELQNALIIFDNVEKFEVIETYFPEPDPNVHILATSRFPIAEFEILNIDILDAKESKALLVATSRRIPKEEDGVFIDYIVRDLDGLPLALEIAGAYLRMKSDISFTKYAELLEKRMTQALPPKLAKAGFTKHEQDVFQTLNISEEIFYESPYLRNILDLLAWSGSSSMGLSVMSMMLGVERIDLVDGLALGVSLRLLKKDTDVERYSIHRLLAKVRREEIPLSERKGWVGECTEKLGAWFTKNKDDFAKLADFESELEHLEAWERNATDDFPEKAVRLIYLKAYPAYHQGRYKDAEKWTRDALLHYEKRKLHQPSLLADILSDQGVLASGQGEYLKALELKKQALEIRKEFLGEKHPDYAISLNNVGSTYHEIGNHRKALEFQKQALEIQKGVLGEKHPDYAISLNDVGLTYNNMGDHQKAFELHTQALGIRKEVLGEKHPNYTYSLSNIGSTYYHMGNPRKALEFHKQVLEIRKEALGEKHPDYASSLNNVGFIYGEIGDAKNAKAYFEQAMFIMYEMLGPNHPKTLGVQRNLEQARIALGGKQEEVRIQLEKRKKKPRKKR